MLENERAVKTFPTFLERAKEFNKSFEWAIKKVTSDAAILFNLQDRGIIKEGAIADLVVLSYNKAVHVFVGGKIVVQDGIAKDLFNGKVLRRV